MRRLGWLVVALVAGLLLGAAAVVLTGNSLARWLGRGPDPETIAEASLKSVKRQATLTVLTARFSAVITSEQTRLAGLFSAKKTLIVPGNVRYEIDWNRVGPGDLTWNAATQTLAITVPAPRVAGPEIDLGAMREYKDGAVLFALTDAENALDSANRARVAGALLAEARAPALTELARDAATKAVQRTFVLPLNAAGFDTAKVTVSFR
ncbi:DUF4230 domain-containing protein [Sandarakinorhabdus sp. DWP1-3-1]|uniref:DUF4230 domain-containing protein n=1 Tax=Sandarakinorhabdus sp. DWP1-3-1 TaxID=2804627 RepID=UPI003CEAE7DE